MSVSGQNRILFARDESGLAGRESEFEALLAHAGSAPGSAILLASAPGTGASDLLRNVYCELFRSGGEIAPVYFKFRNSDVSLRKASERFVHEFLIQLVAFKRREPGIIASYPDACELECLSPAADEAWIAELIRSCGLETELNTESAFVSRAFGAPQRAAISGVKCLVILDGLENTLLLDGGTDAANILSRIYSGGACPFILSGLEKYLDSELNKGRLNVGTYSRIHLSRFEFDEAGTVAAKLAELSGIKVSEQSRDLIATIYGGRAFFMRTLIETAASLESGLETFRSVLNDHFSSVARGRIGGYFDNLIDSVTADGDRGAIYELMQSSVEKGIPTDIESWTKRLKISNGLRFLEVNEIIKAEGGKVTVGSNAVLSDYVEARYRTIVKGDSRQRVFADQMRAGLKRAGDLMAAVYRSGRSLGLTDLVSRFDCQEVPLALLDYGLFDQSYKGIKTEELMEKMRGDLEKIKLPQVYYTNSASEFYYPISNIIEDDRAIVAFGFEHAEYEEENEMVWLAAEIDSKLEANDEVASFWCDRLEMVAAANEIRNYRIWLVAPEGFSPAARQVLHDRHAIGSSRAQANLLLSLLETGVLGEREGDTEYFEIVMPMGEDTELIAAHTIEDIARKKGFGAGSVNQIKTALVEACINAAEHSMSPDGKIRIEINADEQRIEITVTNRGVKFGESQAERNESGEQRRGWGLKLIRTLMDEVTFDRVEDGTRIRMVKHRTQKVGP